MIRFFRQLLGGVFVVIMLAACGLTMSTYQGNGFSMKYPQGWSVSNSDQSKLVTISYANTATYSVDGVITVQAQPLGNNAAAAVVAANEADLKSTSVNQNFTSEKTTMSGQSTNLWKFDQVTGNKTTHFRQAMFVQANTIYTITAAFADTVTNSGDVDEAVKSFTVTK